jgi:hypothetical protein
MSQRSSGYARKPDEQYETVAWPVIALLPHLGEIDLAWDCCDRGSGQLVRTLRSQSVDAIGTTDDFIRCLKPPARTSHLITNPPYGENRRGEMAERFIEHALELNVPHIAMLLRNDFDSAIRRQHLFRLNPMFAGKVILLNRIKWFAGNSSPSDNHAWFLWDRKYKRSPIIRYAARNEAMERGSSAAAAVHHETAADVVAMAARAKGDKL